MLISYIRLDHTLYSINYGIHENLIWLYSNAYIVNINFTVFKNDNFMHMINLCKFHCIKQHNIDFKKFLVASFDKLNIVFHEVMGISIAQLAPYKSFS